MARFRPARLFRRLSSRSDHNSASTTTSTAPSSPPSSSTELPPFPIPIYSASEPRQLRKSTSLPKLRRKLHSAVAQDHADPEVPDVLPELREPLLILPDGEDKSDASDGTGSHRSASDTLGGEGKVEGANEVKEVVPSIHELRLDEEVPCGPRHPILVVEQPTPDVEEELRDVPRASLDRAGSAESVDATLARSTPSEEKSTLYSDEPSLALASPSLDESTAPATHPIRPLPTTRRHPSIVDSANAKVVTTLIDAPTRREVGLPTTASSNQGYFPIGLHSMSNMLQRKIWVKRPGASPTLVQIKEDDLVDDVRDTILRKYANSLGKTFDAPDMVLYIATRVEQGQHRTQRLLGPEEEMCKTMDSYYPGGQTVDEALIIDTPQKRTPRPSPKVLHHASYHAMDEYRPLENGNDYFPPMPAVIHPTFPQTTTSNDSRGSHHHHSVVAGTADHPRSISVLNTGQIAPLPSPGGTTRRHHNRPKYSRQPTSSPTIMAHPAAGAVAVNPTSNVQPHLTHRATARPRLDSSASEAHHPNGIPAPPPLPTPPAPEAPPTNQNHSQPPTPSGGPSVGTHRFGRPRKPRKPTTEAQVGLYGRRKKDSSSASSPHPATSGIALLDGSVPPINVLIVEDNIINLRILEGLMKRLKVRWQTAMNGQIAVDKWRAGGFHLVLMDIQMPVMTGLQATKEIRRLERVNGIGVFSSVSPSESEGPNGERVPGDESNGESKPAEDNHLSGMAEGLFKSPVIIVALTASSLQSDRHEALAAGCNDFLTKPVNFVWLERKVKEWGCMQALIDFEGYRRWKDYAEKAEAGKSEEEKQKDREKVEKDRIKGEKMAKLQEKQAAKAKEEKERKKRLSINPGEGGGANDSASPNPPASATKEKEGGPPNGGSHSPSSLRPGAEVLGESGFELG